uniref:Exported protein n=1 Tax=Bursaphelenchus xylophilus TaxID=6326 RepID=A0A1I7SDL0_BURXY
MKKISVFAFVLLSAANAANNLPVRERFYDGSPSDPDTPISCDSDSVVSTSSEKCLTYYYDCHGHKGKYLEVGDSSEGRLIFFEQNGHTLEEYWDTLAALMYSCLFYPDRLYAIKQKGTGQLMSVNCMTLRKKVTHLHNQLCQFNRRPLANIEQANVKAAKLAETGK